MAITEKTKLTARARMLGVNYKGLDLAALRTKIEEAEKAAASESAAIKATPTVEVTTSPAKSKPAAKSTASKSKPSAAKSAAPAKAKPAAKSTTAKKSATTKVSQPAKKATKTTLTPAAKSTAQKTTAKAGAAQGKAKRLTSGPTKPVIDEDVVVRNITEGKVGRNGYTNINVSAIDWSAESRVGAVEGKRKDVMDGLRRFKGDNAAVFTLLRPRALEYYPNAYKTHPNKGGKVPAAEFMLRWLIGKVRLDFVTKSGQHVSARVKSKPAAAKKATPAKSVTTSAASSKAKPAAKAAAKATSPARKPAASKPARKATPARAKAQKPAGAVGRAKAAPARRGALAKKG